MKKLELKEITFVKEGEVNGTYAHLVKACVNATPKKDLEWTK